MKNILKSTIKSYDGNKMPKEGTHYVCLSVTLRYFVLNPKTGGQVSDLSNCVFLKNVSSKERMKPCFL